MMYRCFYCGVWFCHRCAIKHFRSGQVTGAGQAAETA
jgi:hypothetical protein